MVTSTIIEINNLTKTFGKHKVLDNLNLKINSGDIFGIIGMSGSGKTTLLNTLIGFYKPEDGDILFHPSKSLVSDSKSMKSVFKNLKMVKKSFGFATQNPSLHMKLTVQENLDHFGDLYGLTKDIKNNNIDNLLQLTGLESARHTIAANLSGGMQKRLGIACALIHKPSVLILDEPTADLDPILRKQIWQLIKKINQQGTTIIISSHFVDEIQTLCDQIGILNYGSVVKSGSPNQLRGIYTSSDEIHLETLSGNYTGLMTYLNTKAHLKVTKMIKQEHKLLIYTEKAEKTLHDILHYLETKKESLIDVDVNKPSLAEVFSALAKEKKEV